MRARSGNAAAVVVLIALSFSTFAYVTTENLPIGLLPMIAGDLHRTMPAIGLLVTVYGLVVVAASLPLTKLTQRFPRRQVLIAVMAVFVVTVVLSALVNDYWMLMGARIGTALSQALFWSIITPAAAALFRPEVRPRALSLLYAGSSLAALAGVPAGTWLGQQTSWRVSFLVLSAIGLVVMLTIVLLMPRIPAGRSDADYGSAPDRGRYWAIVVYTAVSVTGAFCAYTYISPFLTQVSGFAESSVGPLLFVRGFTGLIGVFLVSQFVGRYGRLTMVVLIGVQTVALGSQWAFGGSEAATVLSIAASGLTLAGLSSALGIRVLESAPGGSDMASAGTSMAFNIGITGGAFLGGLLLPTFGVRSTALAGALLTLAAFAVCLAEPRFSSRRARTGQFAAGPAPRSAEAVPPARRP